MMATAKWELQRLLRLPKLLELELDLKAEVKMLKIRGPLKLEVEAEQPELKAGIEMKNENLAEREIRMRSPEPNLDKEVAKT